MDNKTIMPSYRKYKESDYLLGKIKLPPWANSKKQKFFVYGDDISIATGITSRLDIVTQADSYFLLEAINIIPSFIGAFENVFVQIEQSAFTQRWSNASVNLRDIAGKGDTPKYLDTPNLLRPTETITLNITNNNASTRQFYVALIGRKIYDLEPAEAVFLQRRMWFQYVMTLPTLTSGQVSQKASVQVFNESDFLLRKIYSTDIHNFVINTATAGTESAEIMMTLKDTSSDLNLFSKKVCARAVCGSEYVAYNVGGTFFTNGDGFMLKKPILIRRNALLEGEFDNRSTTTASGLKLTLEGSRIFDGQPR